MNINTPIILREGQYSSDEVMKLMSQHGVYKTADLYARQMAELFEIDNPSLGKGELVKETQKIINQKTPLFGSWVYFPWSGVLLHIVNEQDLFKIRTNRNKNLITSDEQAELAKVNILVAGMSVGAGIAVGLAYSGIGNVIKLADYDDLETANLNRVRESLVNVGNNKALLCAQRIFEVNPYAIVEVIDAGVTENNIDKLFTEPNIDFIFDETDDFKMKVALRQKSKQYKKPLVMLTSLGDSIIIDIERYDTDAGQLYFNGAAGVSDEILATTEFTIEEIRKFSISIVGREYIPKRALQSVAEMGKTLVGRPQLYGTVAIDGGLGAMIVRKLLFKNLKSGRYYLDLSKISNFRLSK